MRLPSTSRLLAASLVLLGLMSGFPGRAKADWQLFVSADLGYSIGVGKVSGESRLTGGDLGGQDSDLSALLGGAIGVQMPMDELSPWRLPRGWQIGSAGRS